jgi:hypothetical protein
MHRHRRTLADWPSLGLLVLWISSRRSHLLHSEWILPRKAWPQLMVNDIGGPLGYVILKRERLILRAVPRLDLDQIVFVQSSKRLLPRVNLRGVRNEYGLTGMAFLIMLQPAIILGQPTGRVFREANVGIASFDSLVIAIPREVASRSAAWIGWRDSSSTHPRLGSWLQIALEASVVDALPQFGIHLISTAPIILCT